MPTPWLTGGAFPTTDRASRPPLYLWGSLPDLINQELFCTMPRLVGVTPEVEFARKDDAASSRVDDPSPHLHDQRAALVNDADEDKLGSLRTRRR